MENNNFIPCNLWRSPTSIIHFFILCRLLFWRNLRTSSYSKKTGYSYKLKRLKPFPFKGKFFKNFSDTGVVWTSCLVACFSIWSCDVCVEGQTNTHCFDWSFATILYVSSSWVYNVRIRKHFYKRYIVLNLKRHLCTCYRGSHIQWNRSCTSSL